MRTSEIGKLVEGTADAAFTIDACGVISAWNKAAEELFGLGSTEAIGRLCHDVVKGTDESGVVCSQYCTIKQAVEANSPVRNFDLQVQTKTGTDWSNISILIVTEPGSGVQHAVHILRPLKRKRLQQLVRNFVVSEIELEREIEKPPNSSARAGLTNPTLSPREIEILQMLASGVKTNAVAEQLCISRSTVRNHVRNILTKLDVHTRLEAVRHAERAGLI